MILEEFDECKTSTFDPYEVENVIPNFPKIGITCFSKKLLDQYVERNTSEKGIRLVRRYYGITGRK